MTIPNVIVTTQSDEYRRASQLLERFGTVEPTDYFNVLLLTVGDVDRFISEFCELAASDSRLLGAVSRVMPLQKTFSYDIYSIRFYKVWRADVCVFNFN